MELSVLDLPEKTKKYLKGKGLDSVEKIAYEQPKKYLDYSTPRPINQTPDGGEWFGEGILDSVSVSRNGNYTAQFHTDYAENFHITWLYRTFIPESMIGETGVRFSIAGKVSQSAVFGTSLIEPPLCVHSDKFKKGVYPEFRKIRGISDEMRRKAACDSASHMRETLEESVLKAVELRPAEESFKDKLYPATIHDADYAQTEFNRRELLYYAYEMTDITAKDAINGIEKCSLADRYVASLPYKLTEGQQNAITTLKEVLKKHVPTRTLIQGDVGCGKTTIAIYALMMAVEEGVQCAFLAPTLVLAEQHCRKLADIADTVFYAGKMKAAEKREKLAKIKSGEAKVIVGTHAIFSNEVEYNNLGLVIIDEEQRFGVTQREKIRLKASAGVHSISMSATPIPRTLATTVYGDDMSVISVKTMPEGREPVQTCVTASDPATLRHIAKRLADHRQVYVICPMIEDSDNPVMSVEEAVKHYQDAFPQYRVEGLSGRLTDEKIKDVIGRFASNETQILVSTTVVEVGVDVPNADTIVIENAERFGLTTLHQLRGRVGRGGGRAYCVLKTDKPDTERLQVLTRTNDGFEIAEEDLRLRGAGNLIGTEQSGNDRHFELMLMYPEEYAKLKKVARYMKENGLGLKFIEEEDRLQPPVK